MMFEARSSKEVAEVLARHMPANSAGLSSFVSARQACGELRSDIAADVLAEGFFSLTSGFVMLRLLQGVAVDIAADVLAALFELFWTGAAGPGGES